MTGAAPGSVPSLPKSPPGPPASASGATRVLAMGRSSREAAARYAARGTVEIVEVEALEGRELPEAGFETALIRDWLEHQRWDRWALQKIHRALRPDGELVLRVPNLTAVLSPRAIAYAAGKGGQALAGRVARMLGRPPAAFPPFRGRRYRLARLKATLESLGYETESCRPVGLIARLSPALGMKFGDGWVLSARRRPSLFGIDPARPFPDPEQHRRNFEREHHRYFGLREIWLARHPEQRASRARKIDPEIFRGQDVLVLSPHPDDEIIGCGGTLARLIAAGAKVTVIHATDGSEAAGLWGAPDGLRRTARLEEARSVAHAAGFAEVIFWKQDNAAFRPEVELIDRLRSTLESLRPALIFSPWVMDIHPDHLTLNRILAAALEKSTLDWGNTQVIAYEVWGLAPVNLYCVMTDEMKRVERLLLLYDAAMKSDDYVHACESRNFYHGWIQTGARCFAEAFFAVPAPSYPDIVRSAEA